MSFINIVDSTKFKRFRNIRQTSYDRLCPGSSHNRVIRFLGLYCLVPKTFKAQKKNVSDFISRMDDTEWGCCKVHLILHEVGHTPIA